MAPLFSPTFSFFGRFPCLCRRDSRMQKGEHLWTPISITMGSSSYSESSGNAVFSPKKNWEKSPHGSLRIAVLKACFFSDFLHLSVAIWMQLWYVSAWPCRQRGKMLARNQDDCVRHALVPLHGQTSFDGSGAAWIPAKDPTLPWQWEQHIQPVFHAVWP